MSLVLRTNSGTALDLKNTSRLNTYLYGGSSWLDANIIRYEGNSFKTHHPLLGFLMLGMGSKNRLPRHLGSIPSSILCSTNIYGDPKEINHIKLNIKIEIHPCRRKD